MKTLSVKQPWATLLTYGISDIENRSWAPKYEGKILIHVSSSKMTKNYLDKVIFEQMNNIMNEQLFGNIPEFEDMEYSAILGYVTVKGDVNNSTSVWASHVEHQWQIEDAYLFDEPIRNVKGKLNLFDTPEIDENNLPKAHKVVRRVPRLEDDCLIIPITDESYIDVMENGLINLCVTEEIVELVEKPLEEQKEGEYAFKPIKRICLERPEAKDTYEIENIFYTNWEYEDGSYKKVINRFMKEVEYYDIGIQFKDHSWRNIPISEEELEETIKENGFKVSDFTEEELEEIRDEIRKEKDGEVILDGFFSPANMERILNREQEDNAGK